MKMPKSRSTNWNRPKCVSDVTVSAANSCCSLYRSAVFVTSCFGVETFFTSRFHGVCPAKKSVQCWEERVKHHPRLFQLSHFDQILLHNILQASAFSRSSRTFFFQSWTTSARSGQSRAIITFVRSLCGQSIFFKQSSMHCLLVTSWLFGDGNSN